MEGRASKHWTRLGYSVIDSIVFLMAFSILWWITAHEYFGTTRLWEDKIFAYMPLSGLVVAWVLFALQRRTLAGTCISSVVIGSCYAFMAFCFIVQSGV